MVMTLTLSPDACAAIECSVREARAKAIDSLAVCREVEGGTLAAMPESETYQAGVYLATLDNLIDVLDAATSIAVTLPKSAIWRNAP